MSIAQKIFTAHAPYLAADAARRESGGAGALAGLRVSIKDLFDVRSTRTGFGSPTWLATQGQHEAQEDAVAVRRLLSAGGVYVGKTQMDEMAWSLVGENAHYGTPPNPAAPGRIPGGSSSGAAAAVAAGLCDVSLGSDTGGSVRLPASHCGLYGMRPTHGRVPLDGACALAPSLDTAGVFAKDRRTLDGAMRVLLASSEGPRDATAVHWVVVKPCFDALDASTKEGMLARLAPILSLPRNGAGDTVEVVGEEALGGPLSDFASTYRGVQDAEVWAAHGEWVTSARPAFGPGVADRMARAATLDPADTAAAIARRDALAAAVSSLCTRRHNTLLLLPATPAPPPAAGAVPHEWRVSALQLTSIASLARCPQAVFPCLATVDGPVGASVMGAPGDDERVLDGVAAVERLLGA